MHYYNNLEHYLDLPNLFGRHKKLAFQCLKEKINSEWMGGALGF